MQVILVLTVLIVIYGPQNRRIQLHLSFAGLHRSGLAIFVRDCTSCTQIDRMSHEWRYWAVGFNHSAILLPGFSASLQSPANAFLIGRRRRFDLLLVT